MSDNKPSSQFASLGGRFTQFGASLRQSAQELSAKAAASVTELNAKVKEGLHTDGSDPTAPAETSPEDVPTTPVASAAPSAATTPSPLIGSDTMAGATSPAVVESKEAPSPAATPTASGTPAKLEEADRKDLLDILQKMNKKVKALTTLRQQLTQQVETLQQEQTRLAGFVVDEILNGAVQLPPPPNSLAGTGPDPNSNNSNAMKIYQEQVLAQLQAAWRQLDEQKAMSVAQLQGEFQKLRRQQEEDKAQREAQFQAERKLMEEKHVQELVQLKESLASRHAQELSILQQQQQQQQKMQEQSVKEAAAASAISEESHHAAIHQVKEAAAAQLRAFKEKVVAARAAGLEKLRTEMTTSAQEQVRDKLAQQATSHQKEMETQQADLRNQMQQDWEQKAAQIRREEEEKASALLASKVDEIQRQHVAEMQKLQQQFLVNQATEIENARLEAEQAITTDMEEKLEEVHGEMRRKHEQEMEQVQNEGRQKLLQAQQQTASLEQAVKVFEQKIEHLENELEQAKQASSALSQTVEGEELSRQEAEKAARDLQQECSALRAQLEDFKAQSATELQKTRDDFTTQTHALQMELTARLEEVRTREENEKSLQFQLEEARDLLTAARSGQENSSRSLDKALLKQRTQFEAMQKDIQVRANSRQEELERQIQELSQGRDSSASRLRESEDEVRRLNKELDMERSSVVLSVAQLKKELADRESQLLDQDEKYRSEAASLRSERDRLEQVVVSMDLKAEELSRSAETLEGRCQDLEEKLRRAEDSKSSEISDVTKMHEDLIASLTSKLRDKELEVTNLSAIGNQGSEAYKTLQDQYNSLETELERVRLESNLMMQKTQNDVQRLTTENETISMALSSATAKLSDFQVTSNEKIAALDRLNSEISRLREEIEEKNNELSRASIETEKCSQQQTQLINQLRTEIEMSESAKKELMESHAKEIELTKMAAKEESMADLERLLSEARAKGAADKNAEMEEMKSSLEKKLEEAAKKEAAVAQTFNKVKLAYSQKLAKTEKDFSEKIVALEKEKAEMQSLFETSRKEHLEEIAKKEGLLANVQASLDQQVREIAQDKDALILSLREQLSQHLSRSEVDRKELTERIAQLDSELIHLREQMANVEARAAEKVLGDAEAKVRAMEEERDREIQALKDSQESRLKELDREMEAVRLQAETTLAERLQKQTTEFTEQLEVQERRLNEEKESLRKSMELHVDQITAQFKEKWDSERQKATSEISKLQEGNKEKEATLAKVVDRLKSLTASTASLREDNEVLKSRLRTEVSSKQELRSQLEKLRKELDDTVSNSSATATSLLQQQESLEKERKDLLVRLKRLEDENASKSNTVDELNGKLAALSANLSTMAEERKQQDEKLQAASKLDSKLKASEVEVADLREQINKLKLELTRSSGLVERLQAEKETNERNHGQRTALVGMLETQLSEMNDKNAEANAKLEAAVYDLSQKEDLLRMNQEQIQRLEAELAEATNAARRSNEALIAAQKGADSKSGKLVESLQKELQMTKQQMARKSAAAQRLLQEREAECAALKKSNKALQLEVDKGSLSDRRIFELAEKQSTRETRYMAEIESREKIIESLKAALLNRDDELASAERRNYEVEGQVEELCRVRRREDINLDYLKSIVVQYLSLPPGSNERARLLPVLATLLQFDANDYKTIEEGKKKVSWWGSVAPTLINPPDFTGSFTGASGNGQV